MALTLSDIYETTKHRFKLNLLTNNNSLSRPITWVYLAEDIGNIDFIRPGTLIVTTGLSCDGYEWLLHFVKTMMECETCGLIINTGRYVQPEDLTEDIIELCNKYQYPLFTMPWETHIVDLTVHCCNRIFTDSQDSNAISNAFKHLIWKDRETDHYLHVLDEYHYPECGEYRIILLKYTHSDTNNTEELTKRIFYLTENHLLRHKLSYYSFPYKDSIIFISLGLPLAENRSNFDEMLHSLSLSMPDTVFTFGIGDTTENLMNLNESYRSASAAHIMAGYSHLPLCSFDELGFFRLLLLLNDRSFLETYYQEYLGSIMTYDKIHNSEYLETLRQYLLHNGSLQEIAEAMFCHRNTVNYRIHALKEILGYDLSDVKIRFELLVSFTIMDYLNIFPD